MPYYPQNTTGLNYLTYPAGPTPQGISIATGLSANVKGSYTEIAASAAFTCNAVHIQVFNTINATSLYLFDLATGAGGAEVVVIPNMTAEGTNTTTSIAGYGLYSFPLRILSGTRIAATCQSSVGTSQMAIGITLIAAGAVEGVTSFLNYGADTSDSGGLQLDPGGTANTKGSYAQLTASTSAVIQWLLLMVTCGRSTYASFFWLIDLATGAGGSETVLIPDLFAGSMGSSGTTPGIQPRSYPCLTYIAASTRLAARCSASNNTATARLIDVALLTTVAPSEPSSGGASAHPFVGMVA